MELSKKEKSTTGILGHRLEGTNELTYEFVWHDRLGENRYLVPWSWFVKRPQHRPHLKYYVQKKKDELNFEYVGKGYPSGVSTLLPNAANGRFGIRAIVAQRMFGEEMLYEADWGVPYETTWEPISNLVGSEIKLYQFRKLIFKDCNEAVPPTTMELLSLSLELGLQIELAKEKELVPPVQEMEQELPATSQSEGEPEGHEVQYEQIEVLEASDTSTFLLDGMLCHIVTLVDLYPIPTAGLPMAESVDQDLVNDSSELVQTNKNDDGCVIEELFAVSTTQAVDFDDSNENIERPTVIPNAGIENDVYMPVVELVSPPDSPAVENSQMNADIGSLDWKDVSEFFATEGWIEIFNSSNCVDKNNNMES